MLISSAGTSSEYHSDGVEIGQGQGRQACGHFADHGDAAGRQVKAPGGQGGQHDGEYRPGLGDQVGELAGKADSFQPLAAIASHAEQKGQRKDADRHGDKVGVAKPACQIAEQGGEREAGALDAQQVSGLAGGDQDPRGREETRDDRVAEEIGEEPQPHKAHHGEHQPRQQRKQPGQPQCTRCCPAAATPLSAAAVIRATIATGPTARVRLEPNSV